MNSENKVGRAQKFLDNYNLMFDTLNEKQKEAVVNFTSAKKYISISLITLIFGSAAFALGAYLVYYYSFTFYEVSATFEAGKDINFHKYATFFFGRGFTAGIFTCAAFFIFTTLLNLPLLLKTQLKIFDAFLPSQKLSSCNDKVSSN